MMKYYVTILSIIGLIAFGTVANADLVECLEQSEEEYTHCKDEGGAELGCSLAKRERDQQCTIDHDN